MTTVKNFDNKKFVVLTAPHAFCKTIQRDCDKTASYASSQISLTLSKLKVNHILHKSTTLRKYGDMNRLQTKNTKYRKVLTNFIKVKNIVFNLDVHSFPAKEEEDDIYFISGMSFPSNYEFRLINSLEAGLNKKFKKNLIKWGPRACSMRTNICDDSNDIQDEFRGQNIDSILIEFREVKQNENNYKKMINDLCKHIAFWIYMEYFDGNFVNGLKIIFGKNYKLYLNRYKKLK